MEYDDELTPSERSGGAFFCALFPRGSHSYRIATERSGGVLAGIPRDKRKTRETLCFLGFSGEAGI